MKKQIIILLCSSFSFLTQAQEVKNYLHFNIGGGLHNLIYSPQNGTQEGQTGYTANIAYSHFFSSQWGVQTGIGLQTLGALSSLNFIESTPSIDSEGDPYFFKSNFKNWKENQQSINIEIPLTGQFKYRVNSKFGLLSTFGAKISIPLQTTYKITGGELTTSGYYPQWNLELTDLPQHGFTTTTAYSGNYTLKPLYIAVAEIGGTYKLSDKIDLYAGSYYNYGLNNVLNPESKMVYQINQVYNGTLGSYQVSSVKASTYGLKVGFYFQLSK